MADPLILDGTYGGPNADTYITLADADVWIRRNHVFFDEWVIAKPEQQTAALLQATRNIDACNWHGLRWFYNQALEFPRMPPGADCPGGRATPDSAFDSLLLQDVYLAKAKARVRNAACEQALWLLRNEGKDPDREDQFRGATSVSRSAGVSESKGFGGTNMLLHPDAWNELRWYRGSVRLVRGDSMGLQY